MTVSSNKGMSLIEVLVATALVVTVSTVFLTLYYSGNKANTKSKERLDALIQAQTAIEELKAATNIEEGNNTVNIGSYKINKQITADTVTENGVLYNILITVTTENSGQVKLGTKLFKVVE